MMRTITTWWRNRRINALLIERAGLLAEDKADLAAKSMNPYLHRKLGRVQELLRQLGHKESA